MKHFLFFVSYYSRLKQYIRHGGKKQDEPLRIMEVKVEDMTCQPITGFHFIRIDFKRSQMITNKNTILEVKLT